MPPHCVTQFIVKAGPVIVIKFMTAWCVYSLEFYNHQFNPLARRENGKVRECGKGEKEKEYGLTPGPGQRQSEQTSPASWEQGAEVGLGTGESLR